MGHYFLVSVSPPTLSFLENHTIDGVAEPSPYTVHTYAGVSLGVAHSKRRIILAVGHLSSGVLSGVTIAGIAATFLVSETKSGATAELWIASVPTGTSGAIVLTFTDDTNYSAIGAYAAVGLNSATPIDTATAIGSAQTLDLDVSARGLAVASKFGNSGIAQTTSSWSGFSEDFDTLFGASLGTERAHSGASYVAGSTAEPAKSVSNTGMTGDIAGVAASFR